jgi:hypothetical protein
VVEAPVDTYVPPDYTISTNVRRHHELFSGLRNNTFTTEAGTDYVRGLLNGMIVIAAVGVACTVLAPLVYVFISHSGVRARCTLPVAQRRFHLLCTRLCPCTAVTEAGLNRTCRCAVTAGLDASAVLRRAAPRA